MVTNYKLTFLFYINLIGIAYGQSSFHFEKSFAVTFPDDIANQVVYIVFPDASFGGVINVAITSGFTFQQSMGIVKKRIAFIKSSSGYSNQRAEVLDASGPMATQWHIGDYDAQTNAIPIYHLTSTGNTLSVKIEGQVNRSGVASLMQSGISVTDPTIIVNSKTRQYKYIMQERVGIGTATPAEMLSVNGNIRAKEIKVETANWPDYVFEKDYPLQSLPELEAFIDANGHLPGIPVAEAAQANGVSLGEMNRKLLEKIEELTLHLIEKDKENRKLREEVTSIKQRIEMLEKN